VFGFDSGLLNLIELGGQHPHTFLSILQLAALFLAGHHNAGGLVDQADSGGSFIDMLTAGTGGTVDLHFDVRRIDLDIHFLQLRQHCHSGRGGMDSAAGLRLRNPLNPVNTGLILHPGIGTPAVDDKICFLHTAQFRLVIVHQLHLPALFGCVHGVHPEQAVGKEGTFLAAHTATDLHDDAFFVVGVFWQQQNLQLLKQFFFLCLGSGKGLLAQFLHFGIRHQLFGIRHILLSLLIGLEGFYNGLQVIFLPEQLCRLFGVGIKIRLLGFETQFFKFIDNCL